MRIREPGLPAVSECGLVIRLKAQVNGALEDGIARLFDYLGLAAPDCNIARDRRKILATYKDYVSQQWDLVYEEVCKYHSRRQHLDIPPHIQSGSGISLKNWIYSQRKAYRDDELTPLQIRKLEKVGMVWAPFKEKWMRMYRLAQAYSARHGHLNIPAGYRAPDGAGLGDWLANQRELYRQQKLDLRRIHLLERLAVVWSPRQRTQKRYLKAAEGYYRAHGHPDIPTQYCTGDGLRLGD